MELALGVVLGAVFLYVFYRAVQLQWPESYFGATDLGAYAISLSPVRYLVFRLLPPFAACLFVAVSLDRVGASGWRGALGVAGLHTMQTTGWSLIQAARWPTTVFRHRVPIVIIRIVSGLGIMGSGLMAGALFEVLAPLIPPVRELSATLWTGGVAGVIGAYIGRVSRGHAMSEFDMAEAAVRAVPEDTWAEAARTAVRNDADPTLVQAVMAVENLQRPPWFRRLERIKGLVIKEGTYGIMQARSQKPLSDVASIEAVVRERFQGVSVRTVDGETDWSALEDLGRRYNPNPNFSPLLRSAWSAAEDRGIGPLIARSPMVGPDGRPVVEVLEIVPDAGGITVIATAVASEGSLEVHVIANHGRASAQVLSVQASRGAPLRGVVTFTLPVIAGPVSVLITPAAMEETSPATLAAQTAEIKVPIPV